MLPTHIQGHMQSHSQGSLSPCPTELIPQTVAKLQVHL